MCVQVVVGGQALASPSHGTSQEQNSGLQPAMPQYLTGVRPAGHLPCTHGFPISPRSTPPLPPAPLAPAAPDAPPFPADPDAPPEPDPPALPADPEAPPVPVVPDAPPLAAAPAEPPLPEVPPFAAEPPAPPPVLESDSPQPGTSATRSVTTPQAQSLIACEFRMPLSKGQLALVRAAKLALLRRTYRLLPRGFSYFPL